MTKQQTDRYNRYRDYLKWHGCRSLYQHYSSYSNKKAAAWQRISERKCEENGFAFTIVGGGSHYFSTGYLRRITKDNYKSEFLRDIMGDDSVVELVYDYPSGTDYILLANEQRQELSKILCQTI